MKLNTKIPTINLFKYDKLLWCIVAAYSMIILSCSSLWPLSITYSGIGIAITIISSNVKPGYFKVATPFISCITLTMYLLIILLEPIDPRWLTMTGIDISPLSISSLTICLILASIRTTNNKTLKVGGCLIVATLCVGAMVIDILYAVCLISLSVICIVFVGILNKTVSKVLSVFFISGLLFLSIVMLLGNTQDEYSQSDNSDTYIEVPASLQQRFDNIKSVITNETHTNSDEKMRFGMKEKEIEYAQSNFLSNLYSTVRENTGILGCCIFLVMSMIFFLHIFARVKTNHHQYAKCLAICCSLAIIVDTIYNICISSLYDPQASTSVFIQYLMFGIILSCLTICRKAENQLITG